MEWAPSRKLNSFSATVLLPLLLMLLTTVAHATSITYTLSFEGFPDSTPLTTQYAPVGITFSEATVITAGLSLNEIDFPTHSGNNVVFDDGSPISMAFTFPASFVGAYFTYVSPLTMDAFAADGSLLATASSAFSANDVSSGNPPNEFLSVSAIGITNVVITGSSLGNSFTMDDLSFTVPEPASLLLLATGLATLASLMAPGKRRV